MKNPIIPVFAGLLGLFTLWFSIENEYPRDFVGNVLPELIGLCLDGIFFVGLKGTLPFTSDLFVSPRPIRFTHLMSLNLA